MSPFRRQPDGVRLWPLGAKHWPTPFPYPEGHPGGFGTVRKYDLHTGVDLYANPDDPVYACEAGTVVAILWFTGPEADSPWWHNTMAILIEGQSGVLLYGELSPHPWIHEGSYVQAGEEIGTLLTVLTQDKGQPMTMFHFERYVAGTRTPTWWLLNQPQPPQLLDPTDFLASALPLRT